MRLDEAPKAYEMLREKADQCVKVVLRPYAWAIRLGGEFSARGGKWRPGFDPAGRLAGGRKTGRSHASAVIRGGEIRVS